MNHGPLLCRRCGVMAVPLVTPGSGPHYAAATCASCGNWITWLSRYDQAQRQATRQQARREAMGRKAPSALQLSYLGALGYVGAPPASMAEASALIDTLRHARDQKGPRP